jgi:hypothetical protein
MTETVKLPMTGSRGRPLKMAEYLAQAERLRETVDAYRRAKETGPMTTPPNRSAEGYRFRRDPRKSRATHSIPRRPRKSLITGQWRG